MASKREQIERIIEFAKEFSVKAAIINPMLEQAGLPALKQGTKLYELILRPQLTINLLATMIQPLAELLDSLEAERREEIIEAAEILIKYQGYIERERIIADKIQRLENLKIKDRFNYSEINALSTEARQKLERINPETVAQASRIPGISPSDINILLLLLGR